MYFTLGLSIIHDENPTHITVITDKTAHTKTEDTFKAAASKNLLSCCVMVFFIIEFRFLLLVGQGVCVVLMRRFGKVRIILVWHTCVERCELCEV